MRKSQRETISKGEFLLLTSRIFLSSTRSPHRNDRQQVCLFLPRCSPRNIHWVLAPSAPPPPTNSAQRIPASLRKSSLLNNPSDLPYWPLIGSTQPFEFRQRLGKLSSRKQEKICSNRFVT